MSKYHIEASYRQTLSNCLPGTRSAVIREVEKWFDSWHDLPICWLNGPAGCGKSAVSRVIAEKYDQKKRLAASFFFFRGDRNKITSLVPTLACQLSISKPDTREHILREINSDRHLLDKSPEVQFMALIIRTIKASSSIFSRKLLIIIDAMDECDDKLLMGKFIDTILKEQLPFRILITSRVEEHFRARLDTPEARSKIKYLELDKFDATEDIRMLFNASFARMREVHSRVLTDLPDSWPSDANRRSLVKKCEGSFIFAATLLNFLETTEHPKDRLKDLLTAKAGLDALYTQVFQSAFQAMPRDATFDRILRTVMLTTTPLPITALEELLQLKPGYVVYPMLSIQSILKIPSKDDQPILLLHTSFRDFLESQSRSKELYINPPYCHLLIAVDCLKSICKPPKAGIFYKGGQRYACLNWFIHINHAFSISGANILADQQVSSLITDDLPGLLLELWFNTIIASEVSQVLENISSAISHLEVMSV